MLSRGNLVYVEATAEWPAHIPFHRLDWDGGRRQARVLDVRLPTLILLEVVGVLLPQAVPREWVTRIEP